ncbi:hypothetical protein [Iningainema tapete]|uniref:Uncharacterized protein n=1 Tax=Iningainema tapete BLCC-T55 TaxID=2748662 RepID=A0A8J7CA21_9CYAN|nr:hypothetical protein [Iningainema tapete]MBD2778784.1 hypothetical protein [Iningainema tapete BLCC-T55]
MRFSKKILSLLLGVLMIAGAGCVPFQSQQPSDQEPPQAKTPLTVEQIDKIAEEITVRIDSASSGSGMTEEISVLF